MLSLTYVSTVPTSVGADQLLHMLVSVRPRNEAAGVTGMLLYADGNVMQTLEGPGEAVDDTFTRIERDPRHHGIIVILRQEIEQRAFPDWSMGFRRYGRTEFRDVDGVNSYLARRDAEPNATSAELLLETFRDTMR